MQTLNFHRVVSRPEITSKVMKFRPSWSYSAVFLLLLLTNGELSVEAMGGCDSKQYVELGKVGTIKCSFQEGFYGVYWYNSVDVTQNPFFYYEQLKKSGKGFETGEFDVENDGSLVIRNVSLQHDHEFTVAILSQKTDEAISIIIDVVVVVAPKSPYPIINQCRNDNNCYKIVDTTPNLTCMVKDSRPHIKPKWYRRTTQGDREIVFEESTKLSNERFTSYAYVTNHLFDSDNFEVLVCKVTNAPPLITFNDSVILLELAGNLDHSFTTEEQFVEKNSELILTCTTDNAFIIVWKMNDDNRTSLILGQVAGKRIFHLENFETGDNGNRLIMHQAGFEHEGTYTCRSSDGEITSTSSFRVSIYVQPVPRYPVVEGCSHHHCCVLTTESEGKLTCKLTGIRPVIQLKWKVFHSNAAGDLSFFNEKLTITQNGEIYDVFLTAYFRLNDKSKSKLTVECAGYGMHAEMFGLSTKLDLMFVIGGAEVAPPSNDEQSKTHTVTVSMSWLMIIATLVSSLVVFLLSGLLFKNGVLGKLFARKEERNSSLIYEALSVDDVINISGETSLTSLEENNEDQTLLSRDKFLKLQEYIGMNEICESGLLDFSDVTDMLRDQPTSTSASLLFFQRLLSNDNNATTVFREVFQDEVSQVNLENDEQLLSIVHETVKSSTLKTTERDFSCRDALFAIYHSCKLPLRHSVLSKMSELRLAVPLLLPDPFKRDQVTLLLSDLRNVHKVWTEKGLQKSASVSDYPFPTIATMRIGGISVSKGRILNMIIGRLQDVGNPSAFIKSEDDNHATVWSTGTVEAVWFLPNDTISSKDYALPVATCFLNLRGKMQTTNSRPQERFLNLFAMCVVIFIEKSSFNEYYDSVINAVTDNTKVIVVVISDKVSAGQNSRRVLRKGNYLTVIVCERCSELRIAIELCKEIVKVLEDNKPSKTLDKEGKLLCKELNIGIE